MVLKRIERRRWVLGFLGAALLLAGGAAALTSAPSNPYRPTDKAYYLDERTVNFVRPGLVIRITKTEITADNTLRVTFKLADPRGLPLDREGIVTPGIVNTSFVVAYIPQNQSQYTSYTTRVQTSPITGKSAVQAGSDTGGRYDKIADGEYLYTFGTKLATNFERNSTHTVLIYGSRNLSEFDLPTNYDDEVFTWVPSGAAVTKVRDMFRAAMCNKCHQDLGLHGGSRKSIEGCILCHQPQTVDPDTGNTVDMKVMAHKIHMGADLPSVQAGGEYCIIGNQQNKFCFNNVEFVAGPNRCEACHDTSLQGANRPAQVDAYLKNPSRAACGACHDNVNFDTGENHVNLPQPSDNLCANCHIPQGEIDFDASIKGGHMTPTDSGMLPGSRFEITAIEDGVAGRRPRVTFTVKDKAGAVIPPADMTSLSLVLAGPTTDYASYVSESARTAQDAGGGRYTYTFTNAIPAAARGSFSIGMEGYRNVTLLPGTQRQMTVRDAGTNVVRTFTVDGSPVVNRRASVDLTKCNACHYKLSLHGGNRNQVQQCVLCHNPNQTDVARRPADKAPAESVQFAVMIHRIHSGSSQTRDLTIYGFGNTPHNYNKAGFPGRLYNCAGCHIDNSYRVPSKAVMKVADARHYLPNPGPQAAPCLGCHGDESTAAHADIMSNAIGESCATCHSADSTFSVDKMHAR
ncbi:MAG: OmcA/MtrC family decaheme c-type cytochrome [Acidobacteria bacterium]|nr:OmcA/MtrC family decaheme c-type cytochrome [Acidobacteriota bacterium]